MKKEVVASADELPGESGILVREAKAMKHKLEEQRL
jgi:hypothetical protein